MKQLALLAAIMLYVATPPHADKEAFGRFRYVDGVLIGLAIGLPDRRIATDMPVYPEAK
jgi:hypothetical protein